MADRVLTLRELNRSALTDEGKRLLRFVEADAKAYDLRFADE